MPTPCVYYPSATRETSMSSYRPGPWQEKWYAHVEHVSVCSHCCKVVHNIRAEMSCRTSHRGDLSTAFQSQLAGTTQQPKQAIAHDTCLRRGTNYRTNQQSSCKHIVYGASNSL
eukprot:1680254-Amphidinium_carterae.1